MKFQLLWGLLILLTFKSIGQDQNQTHYSQFDFLGNVYTLVAEKKEEQKIQVTITAKSWEETFYIQEMHPQVFETLFISVFKNNLGDGEVESNEAWLKSVSNKEFGEIYIFFNSAKEDSPMAVSVSVKREVVINENKAKMPKKEICQQFTSIEKRLKDQKDSVSSSQSIANSRKNDLIFEINSILNYITNYYQRARELSKREKRKEFEELRQKHIILSRKLDITLKERQIYSIDTATLKCDILITQLIEDIDKDSLELIEIIESKIEILGSIASAPVTDIWNNYKEVTLTNVYEVNKVLDSKLQSSVISDSLQEEYKYLERKFISYKKGIREQQKELRLLKRKKEKLLEQADLYYQRDESLIKNDFLIIDSVQMEFMNGALKNIIVTGKDKQGVKHFTNLVPISVSSISDLSDFSTIKLYNARDYSQVINFGDVVEYNIKLQLNAEDYSPRNQVVRIKPEKSAAILYKEKTSELFKGRIYTDLVGIDDDLPNGLVQVELSKKIYLYTRKTNMPGKKTFWGGSNYIEPFGQLSKIENNNKYIPLNKDASGKSYTTTHTLAQYTTFHAGANYNLVVFDVPRGKSSFYLNTGLSVRRALVSDTIMGTDSIKIEDGYPLNMMQIKLPEILWEIKPDERYGAVFGGLLNYIDLLNKKVIQSEADNYKKAELKDKFLLEVSGNFFYKISPKSELFFRIAHNIQLNDPNLNYLQAQVGYWFKIVKGDD